MLCPISVVHLEKPMNNQEPKRDNNPTRLVVTLCSEKQKQFSTSLYSTQTFNTWLQRFPSSFSSISLITLLNRFTCLPSIVVSSISFHTSNDYMNMLNWESAGIIELLWLCSMQLSNWVVNQTVISVLLLWFSVTWLTSISNLVYNLGFFKYNNTLYD